MNTNTHEQRYPKQYIVNSSHSVASSTNTYYVRDNDKPVLMIINELIISNRDEIIKMYDNNEHNKIENLIKNLLKNLMNDQQIPLCISDTLPEYSLRTITTYYLECNDVESFKIITHNHRSNFSYIDSIITYVIAHHHGEPIKFLDILINNGVKIKSNVITYAIMTGNISIINYFIINNYDISEGWHKYLMLHRSRRENTKIASIPMLKILLQHNIVQPQLKSLLDISIANNDLCTFEFIIESFPDHDIIHCLDKCCIVANKEILLYLLKRGVDVSIVKGNYLLKASLDFIKILIDHNYSIPVITQKYLLIKYFTNNCDINDAVYLIKNDVDIKLLFDNEEERKDKTTPYNSFSEYSNLEYVTMRGHIGHIKFLAENYLDLLKPEINRLFVIACANGRNDIASYLFDLGAEVNNKALISAIFFGHYDTVIMLLKFGMEFSSIMINNNNLFTLTSIGYKKKGCVSKIYDDLIRDNIIFRNDIYNYGDDIEYVNIIKLLISYNIPIGNTSDNAYFFKNSHIFYKIEIFEYFIQNCMDINIKCGKYSDLSLLDMVICGGELNVIEFLLQNNIDKKIIYAHEHRDIIDNNKQLKTLLLKYGITLTDKKL